MAKFGVFEVAVEKLLQATGKSKDSLTGAQSTGLNLTAGLIAGLAAAVISQPADTLLSKINKTKGAPGQGVTSRLVQMAGQLGAAGLFTGMGARLVMIGTLTAGQCESSNRPESVSFPRLRLQTLIDPSQSLSTVISKRCSTPRAVLRSLLSPNRQFLPIPLSHLLISLDDPSVARARGLCDTSLRLQRQCIPE